jgi:hypothetical protein
MTRWRAGWVSAGAVLAMATAGCGALWPDARPTPEPTAQRLFGAVLAYDGSSGGVVAFGGLDSGSQRSGSLAVTWRWTGGRWTSATTPSAPPARSEPLLASDPAGHRVLLFGGSTVVAPSCRGCGVLAGPSPDLSDTWEFTGGAWKRLAPGGPMPRGGRLLAADPALGTFVLVGKSRAYQPGSGPGTWKWTGGRWTLLSSTVPVDATSLAYDPVSHRLIAYAGRQPFSPSPKRGMGVSSVSGYSRTWAFTGGRWVELLSENTPVQQPEEAPGVLAPGPDDGRLMLINALGRTWTWTGRGWRPYLTRGGPAGGRVPWGGTLLTAGTDPARHQLVLLATGSNDETWTLSSGRWTRRAGTP